MMKKITRIAALLAATALLLAGFPACSDDDGDDDPTLEKIEIGIDEAKLKIEYDIDEEFDKTDITVTATYSNGKTEDVTAKADFKATTDDGEPFTTETEGTYTVTLTATYEGKTATKTCEITVKASDSGTGEGGGGSGSGTEQGDGNGDGDGKEEGGNGGEVPTVTNIEIAVATTVKTEYDIDEDFDKTGITVTATLSDGKTKEVTDKADFKATTGDGEPFSTATAGTFDVTLTATYEGKTATATRTITVKAKGKTYEWNFQAAGLKNTLSYSPSTDEATPGKDQLDAEGTYESTPPGLTLVLPKGAVFNKVDPTMSASNASSVGASTGAIEPHESADITVKVRGPFTAVMLCGSNATSDKTNRYAYIKVNDEEVVAPGKDTTTLLAAGETLSYTYTGTDEVTVAFGVSKDYVRIYDIKITTENGDDTDKTAGEVKSKAEFVATTDDTTANDEATLGLVGTNATSSDPKVATATIENDKIIITSVSAGTAIITVTDGTEGHEATIAVTVKPNGVIILGTPTKYFDSNAVVEKANWVVTVENYKGVTTGDSGLNVKFVSKSGGDSAKETDFSFDGASAKLTITTPKLVAGKTITIDVYGFSGSSGNAADITLSATNATATTDNVTENKITFPADASKIDGTFVYTVTAEGPVTLVFKRVLGKTTRVSKLEITVGDSNDATTAD